MILQLSCDLETTMLLGSQRALTSKQSGDFPMGRSRRQQLVIPTVGKDVHLALESDCSSSDLG